VGQAETPVSGSRPRKAIAIFLLVGPILALPLFVTLTQSLEESYPFSHFPMYKDPSPTEFYLFVADETGEPLPIAHMAGVSAAKVKKRWKSRLSEVGADWKDEPSEAFEQTGRELLASLRELAAARKRPFPETVQLVRADISYLDDQFREDLYVVATEKGAAP